MNPDIVPELEAAGLRFTGRDETGRRMEILELAPPQDGEKVMGRQAGRQTCEGSLGVWTRQHQTNHQTIQHTIP